MRLSLLKATKEIQEFDGRFIIEILLYFQLPRPTRGALV
jgi:hypothetical protein